MCDPLTIAGVALTAASTVAGGIAQGQVDSARSDVMNRELFRQAGFDNEAAGINNKALGRYENAQADADAKRKEVADFYKTNSGELPTSGPTSGAIPPTSSNIIVQEGKKQQDKVGAFNTQQNEALAGLRSFGDFFGDVSRGTARDAGQLGMVNSFKKGSQAVVPLELQQANTAGNGTKLLGDILGGLGSVGTFAGLSGVNPFGGSGITVAGSPASAAAPHGTKPIARGFNLFGTGG